jgi:hypothetical protein
VALSLSASFLLRRHTNNGASTPPTPPPHRILPLLRMFTVDDIDASITFDVEDDCNHSVNDSFCPSTSSGDQRSGAGDEATVLSRREYEQHLEELASKETRAVTKLRFLVFGSLFFSMMAVVLSAYYLTTQGERHNFELQFYDDANKILGNMGHNLQRTMEAADAFIASITSYAAHTN